MKMPRSKRLCPELRRTISARRRTYLLPVLHAIQNRIGWISEGALNYASRQLDIPPADSFGVASFYGLLSTAPQPPSVAHVCDDIACKVKGADRLCAELEKLHGPAGSSKTVEPHGSEPLSGSVRACARSTYSYCWSETIRSTGCNR